jgi:hypothetical protein
MDDPCAMDTNRPATDKLAQGMAADLGGALGWQGCGLLVVKKSVCSMTPVTASLPAAHHHRHD